MYMLHLHVHVCLKQFTQSNDLMDNKLKDDRYLIYVFFENILVRTNTWHMTTSAVARVMRIFICAPAII